MTKCEQTRYMVDKYGIDWANNNLSNPEHSIGTYKSPEKFKEIKMSRAASKEIQGIMEILDDF